MKNESQELILLTKEFDYFFSKGIDFTPLPALAPSPHKK